MLPPPLWGGNATAVAGSSGCVPIVPRKGAIGHLHAGDKLGMGAPAQVEGLQVGIGKVIRQGPEAGKDHAPAPVAGLQGHDVDTQRVSGTGAFDVQGSEQVVERGEVEARVLEAVALPHLAVPGHEDVVVDDVPRRHVERRLERVVPAVVDALRIDPVLHRSSDLTDWLNPGHERIHERSNHDVRRRRR